MVGNIFTISWPIYLPLSISSWTLSLLGSYLLTYLPIFFLHSFFNYVVKRVIFLNHLVWSACLINHSFISSKAVSFSILQFDPCCCRCIIYLAENCLSTFSHSISSPHSLKIVNFWRYYIVIPCCYITWWNWRWFQIKVTIEHNFLIDQIYYP